MGSVRMLQGMDRSSRQLGNPQGRLDDANQVTRDASSLVPSLATHSLWRALEEIVLLTERCYASVS